MEQVQITKAKRKNSHPRSKRFKAELTKRLKLIISTFPEIRRKSNYMHLPKIRKIAPK